MREIWKPNVFSWADLQDSLPPQLEVSPQYLGAELNVRPEDLMLDGRVGVHSGTLADGYAGWHKPVRKAITKAWRASTTGNVRNRPFREGLRFFNAFMETNGQDPTYAQLQSWIFMSGTHAGMAAAKTLHHNGKKTIAVPYPSLLNITHMLMLEHLDVVPFPETMLDNPEQMRRVLNNVDAIYWTAPNNPTGKTPSPRQFAEILQMCAATDTVAVVDLAFASHLMPMSLWDQFGIADRVDGLDAILLRDTGKTWNITDGLKLGIATVIGDMSRSFGEVGGVQPQYAPSLVSGLLTNTIDSLCTPYRTGTQADAKVLHGPLDMWKTFSRNRDTLGRALKGTGVKVVSSEMTGVAYCKMPDHWRFAELDEALLRNNLVVMPGSGFLYPREQWNERDSYFRVSLNRPADEFEEDVMTLRSTLREFGLEHGSDVADDLLVTLTAELTA